VADQDARVDQFVQMADQHALGDVRNAAAQFSVRIGPMATAWSTVAEADRSVR